MTGGIAIALAVSAPAHAQQRADAGDANASTNRQDGIPAADASNGFQLIEHRIWQRAQEVAPPISTDGENGRIALPYRYEPGHRGSPSEFRRASFLPQIYAAEARYSLPAGLLDALVWTESRYNPTAVSKAGAAGLGQLMPGTARNLGVSNRFDPMANVNGAARYLRQMLDKFGVVHLALAAYNAGPGAVARARGIPRNGETPAYVRNVLRHWRN